MTGPARPSARCRALLLEVSRYLDGDLPPARRQTIERHIEACACCGTLAIRLQRTMAACSAMGTRQPPRAVMSRAAERIRALMARERPRPRGRVRPARGTHNAAAGGRRNGID